MDRPGSPGSDRRDAVEGILQRLADTLSDAILVARYPGYRIEYASPGTDELLGYTAREVVGRSLADLLPPEANGADLEARLEEVFGGSLEQVRCEQVLVHKEGGLIWAEIQGEAVSGADDEARLLAVVRDVTERKLAEEALSESHARLELLNSISRGLRAGMSLDRVIELTLERLHVHFQEVRVAYSRIDADGDLEVLHSREPPGMPSLAGARAVLTRAPVYLAELRSRRPVVVRDVREDPRTAELADVLEEGGSRAVLDVPMRRGDAIVGVLCLDAPEPREWSVHEVTTLAEVAEYLSIAIGDALAEREREELESQLRQSQKMEAVGRLAGGIAHDFNNLLTGISGSAELARLRSDDAELVQELDNIRDLVRRSARLTRQLLAFSRRQPLEMKPVDVNRLLDDLAEMMPRVIGEDIDVRFELGEEVGHVLADPGQVEQVLMNLAVNARDAMPEGGRLSIETSSVELGRGEGADDDDGSWILLAVSDTGIGIDPARLERIFEPFFTTKEKGKGTGLGLSTAYGIVKQHGGFIRVESEPGEGTTFRVYLPSWTDDEGPGRALEDPGRP